MNGLHQNTEEIVECPLCMEPLEVDDLHFFPCTCGYQICRFCWHRIRTDENELCPACRKEYPENPADFTPLTQEEMIAFKSQKRQRDQQRKQKVTENRKHLANVRVVQKNLVFVVGLPPRLADSDILKKHEYFGKYGKIHKVVINPSTTYAGAQGPSASAYVTYVHNCDALRAIQSVNNIMIDGRLIKTSLGTTKYCSHFMKNQQCPKNDCMYLHELGDSEASFTKEEMHQGKHQEYEKRLHDALVNSSTSSSSGGSNTIVSGITDVVTKNNESCKQVNSSVINITVSNTSPSHSPSNLNDIIPSDSSKKEAWPSLYISPVNKDTGAINVFKLKKEKLKQDKSKSEKNGKTKLTKNFCNTDNSRNNCNLSSSRENLTCNDSKDSINEVSSTEILKSEKASNTKFKSNKSNLNEKQLEKLLNNLDENLPTTEDKKDRTNFNVAYESYSNSDQIERDSFKSNIENRSISLNNNNGDISSSICQITNGKNSKNISELGTNLENSLSDIYNNSEKHRNNHYVTASDRSEQQIENKKFKTTEQSQNISSTLPDVKMLSDFQDMTISPINAEKKINKTNSLTNLNMYDSNSFFSSSNSLQPILFPNKLEIEMRQPQMSSAISSHLPDLLNGLANISDSLQNTLENRASNSTGIQQQLIPQQNHSSNSSNIISNNLFATNMTKFFDFHKHQQQEQHQQQQYLILPPSDAGCSTGEINSNFYDNNQRNMNFLEQSNDNFFDQDLSQKRTFLGKFDSMLPQHHHQMQQQRIVRNLQSPQQLYHPKQTTQTGLSNQTARNSSVEDDLGFDPFIETQKELAKLIEDEAAQLQNSNIANVAPAAHMVNQHQLGKHQPQMLDNLQRARMPPPGFNHMNSFGFGSPRIQGTSKVLPFASNNSIPMHDQMQEQPIQLFNSWNHQLNNLQPQLPSLRQQQPLQQQQHQIQNHHQNQQHQLQHQNQLNHLHQQYQHLDPPSHTFMQNGNSYKGYSNHDWTVMDPAILSFRQYSAHSLQQQNIFRSALQQEMFLQQITQQQKGQSKN